MKIIGKTLQDIEILKRNAELEIEEKTLLQELEDTDWYVTRFYETNKEIPIDIKNKRDFNRSRLSEIRKILITYINENTLNIDGEDFEFDIESIIWEDINTLTSGKILEAKRVAGELWVKVIRFYSDTTSDWDTGDYHVIER